ncbi:WD40-repeat-containing domain protein, partial [Lanmaoa asiatica]
VAFHPDGIHLLSGGLDGIRKWRLADGEEVGKQTGMEVKAISVSNDQKWIVCGASRGASVWDGGLHEKVVEVEGGEWVLTVDVSPDSTRLATGTTENVSVWSISSGERLVGPLKRDKSVYGIRFSPNGEHLATACRGGSICIFDSRNGDKLFTIETVIPSFVYAATPLAWSNNGQRIFATSEDKKIRTFDASTGSEIAVSHILNDDDDKSIALAANGKFVAT